MILLNKEINLKKKERKESKTIYYTFVKNLIELAFLLKNFV